MSSSHHGCRGQTNLLLGGWGERQWGREGARGREREVEGERERKGERRVICTGMYHAAHVLPDNERRKLKFRPLRSDLPETQNFSVLEAFVLRC